jgi:hypothetical protein
MKRKTLFLLLALATTLVLTDACTKSDDVEPDPIEQVNEDPDDYTVDSTGATQITLKTSTIAVGGPGAAASGSKVTISKAGTYRITGTLTNGQIVVNTTDVADVKLVFDGITVTNTTGAPVNVEQAEKVIINLADGTKNTLTDGATYTLASGTDEPNAALFSKADLTLYGGGALTIKANYNDGIASKDGLLIKSGTYTVSAKDDGIRGKDYLVVEDGTFTLEATGDGLKSDNEEDASRGYITIKKGTFGITTGGDGIQAQTQLTIADGTFTITTGGGSGKTVASTASAKALKSAKNLTVDGGTFAISAADDAVHANNAITINGGTFALSTADDAVHADNALTINGGKIDVTKSYEGLESLVITITDGTIHLVSSDDGLNAAGSTTGRFLNMKGGYLFINSGGDGVDVNGSADMSGGTIIVNGPTANNNAALDYDGTFKITGGTLIATGSSGMAQVPGTTSTQNSVLVGFTSTQPAGTLVRIESTDGKEALTFKPGKSFQSMAFSSPGLVKGTTYNVFLGGSATGTVTDGLYENPTYTAGTKNSSFTVASAVTKVNSR